MTESYLSLVYDQEFRSSRWRRICQRMCKMRHLDWSLSKGQNLNALQNTAPARYRWYTHVTLPSKWGTTIWMKKYNRKKSTVICVLEDIWFHRNHQRRIQDWCPPPPPTHTHTSQPLYLEGGGLVVFVFDCKTRIYFNCVNYVYLILNIGYIHVCKGTSKQSADSKYSTRGPRPPVLKLWTKQ